MLYFQIRTYKHWWWPFSFVLLGRFQSDSLEGRFSLYRQLNGGCCCGFVITNSFPVSRKRSCWQRILLESLSNKANMPNMRMRKLRAKSPKVEPLLVEEASQSYTTYILAFYQWSWFKRKWYRNFVNWLLKPRFVVVCSEPVSKLFQNFVILIIANSPENDSCKFEQNPSSR